MQKINTLESDILSIDNKILLRPTQDDVDQQFVKLQGYATMKAFNGLSKLVSMKADQISADEQRITIEAAGHRSTRIESSVTKVESEMNSLKIKLEKSFEDTAQVGETTDAATR